MIFWIFVLFPAFGVGTLATCSVAGRMAYHFAKTVLRVSFSFSTVNKLTNSGTPWALSRWSLLSFGLNCCLLILNISGFPILSHTRYTQPSFCPLRRHGKYFRCWDVSFYNSSTILAENMKHQVELFWRAVGRRLFLYQDGKTMLRSTFYPSQFVGVSESG